MTDQNEKKIEIDAKANNMPLGTAMDMAEYAVKGKSKKERKLLGDNLPANDNALSGAVSPEIKTGKIEKHVLTPQQKDIVDRLNSAKNSQQRVEIFATIADDIGLDPLISLIPELGDAGSSIVSGVYLLYEAKKADLGGLSYLKIIALQATDFAIGFIPVVGDVADYFFKANKWSTSSFEKKTKEIEAEARKAGVPEEKIQQISGNAKNLPKLIEGAVSIYKTTKGKSKNVEPTLPHAA